MKILFALLGYGYDRTDGICEFPIISKFVCQLASLTIININNIISDSVNAINSQIDPPGCSYDNRAKLINWNLKKTNISNPNKKRICIKGNINIPTFHLPIADLSVTLIFLEKRCI